jgi:hypothetical protein
MKEPQEGKRRHKLLPKAIREKIPPLYSHDGKPHDEIPVAVKFFSPYSGWKWYATEGQQEGDDFLFFGYVVGFEREFGYFSFRELAEVAVFGGKVPAVERDCYFGDHKLSEFVEQFPPEVAQ